MVVEDLIAFYCISVTKQAKLGKQTALPLQGNVVLVTGGASGIGFETARHFTRQGAAVVVADISLVRKPAFFLGNLEVTCLFSPDKR